MKLVYERLDTPGLEELELSLGEKLDRAEGSLLHGQGETALRYLYSLERRADGEAILLTVERSDGASLRLERNGSSWRLDHRRAERLAGCDDVDLSLSPVTNMLTLRRLGIWEKEAETVTVAFVDLETMQVRPVEQSYTCQKYREDGGEYLYQNEESGLELTLHFGEGMILDEAEGLFSRRS